MKLGYAALGALFVGILITAVTMSLMPTKRLEQLAYNTYPFVALLLGIVSLAIVGALLVLAFGEKG
jgi:hypothetical protein